MNSYGKKFKEEWAFFLSPVTQKLTYNDQCKKCKFDCKQSFCVEIVRCPYFEKKEDGQC